MNMKWLINLSRVAVLTACAIWLMTRTPGVHAQIMNCYTYNTENGVQLCNSCCTSQPLGDNWTDGTISGAGIQVLSPQNAASLRVIPATREPVPARSFAFRAPLVVPAGPREHRAAQTRTAAAETAPTANAQNAPLVARRWVTSAPAARSSSTLRGRASNLLTSRMAYISGGNQTDPDTRCRGPILLAGTAGSSCQTPMAKSAMRRTCSRR